MIEKQLEEINNSLKVYKTNLELTIKHIPILYSDRKAVLKSIIRNLISIQKAWQLKSGKWHDYDSSGNIIEVSAPREKEIEKPTEEKPEHKESVIKRQKVLNETIGESKSLKEFENKVSDALYRLNKEAKAYGAKSVSGNYKPHDVDKQKELYDLKTKLIKQFGEDTGEIHKFETGGYGKLYKIGDNTFHEFIPNYVIEEPLRNKIVENFILKNKELLEDKKIDGINFFWNDDFHRQQVEVFFKEEAETPPPEIPIFMSGENKGSKKYVDKWGRFGRGWTKKEKEKYLEEKQKYDDSKKRLREIQSDIRDKIFQEYNDYKKEKFPIVEPPKISEKGNYTEKDDDLLKSLLKYKDKKSLKDIYEKID